MEQIKITPLFPTSKGQVLAGVDEVGRGPLAGDVVAAAVILGADHGIVGITDSKKLSEKKRLLICEQIKQKARSWCVARASVEEIDEINILQASLLAMKRAVEGLSMQPDHILVDGNKLPRWTYSSEAVIGGDNLVLEIGAASILAKVTRDLEMIELDRQYPDYGFAKHKGYPTKQHIQALALHGPCAFHRRSYAPVKKVLLQACD